MMHQPGTPWTQTWDEGRCGKGAIINNGLIERYYKERIEKAASNE